MAYVGYLLMYVGTPNYSNIRQFQPELKVTALGAILIVDSLMQVN